MFAETLSLLIDPLPDQRARYNSLRCHLQLHQVQRRSWRVKTGNRTAGKVGVDRAGNGYLQHHLQGHHLVNVPYCQTVTHRILT